uniref:Ig-like domain-containing protein n=1 Tax=Varanus komodoensis TaxID=61221 RepID=A0A8D2IVI5_VARKO
MGPFCLSAKELVEQSFRYMITGENSSLSVNCMLKNAEYPWMSWYVKDLRGQLHFLATFRQKGEKETKTWRGSSYDAERGSNTELRVVVNVAESQILYCTCSRDHKNAGLAHLSQGPG